MAKQGHQQLGGQPFLGFQRLLIVSVAVWIFKLCVQMAKLDDILYEFCGFLFSAGVFS